jgi:protein-S-isoprenylcysteine O-methyltransferase Ste14
MGATLQDLFSNRALRKFLYRTRYLLAVLLVVPLARYMDPAWLPAAVGISLFGQLIQAWCFASLVKNLELSVRGPYLLARNPMYLGRFFLILGFVCLIGRPLAIVAYTAVYYLYMVTRVKREERRLRRVFGDEYERYCREVRRFLPSLSRLGDPAVRFFDSEMFLQNHGHWNILLTLAAYAAVYAIHVLAFS